MILDTNEVAARRSNEAEAARLSYYIGLAHEAEAVKKLAEAEASIAALRLALAEERAFTQTVAEELQTTTGLYWRLRSELQLTKRRAADATADYEAGLARAEAEASKAKAEAEAAKKRAAEADLAARTYQACFRYASEERSELVARLATTSEELAEERRAHKVTAEAAKRSRQLYEEELAAHEDTKEELNEERSEAARLARYNAIELAEERAANHAVIGSLIHSEEALKRAAEEAEERAARYQDLAMRAARTTAEVLAEAGIAEEPDSRPASEHTSRYYVVLEDTDYNRVSEHSRYYQWAFSSLEAAEAKIAKEAEADEAIKLLYLARIIRYGSAYDS